MFTEGFVTGVNYWASNAGIKMWSEFDEATIDKDFEKISKLKMDVIRLFPIWSEFQPLEILLGGSGTVRELRFPDETIPPDTFAGRGAVKEEMLDRFEKVLRLAEKHSLKVAVGILTGWMSGRTFIPQCLIGKNLITDPLAIRMAMDFIRVFVTRFKDDPTIVGWTSGNETDCLSGVGTTNQDRDNWAMIMRNAIRSADTMQRPIMEDMHPMRTAGTNALKSRRDIFDVSTVHPYTYFSPYCTNEPVNSMRGLLHDVAETKAHEGVAKIPCLVEEIGTLGDFNCSLEVSAGYTKTHLYSTWANGSTGMIWWCANEQVELKYPPYTWHPLERELGIFDKNGNEKPVAKEFRDFKETINALPFKITPPKSDALCVLSGEGDDWGKILGSCVLSKQAGFNISYAHQSSIPESNVYIIPSLYKAVPGEILEDLLNRVATKGATIVFTYGKGLIFSEFEKLSGNKLITNSDHAGKAKTDIGEVRMPTKLHLESTHSTVLVKEDDGNPFVTVSDYGKGKVIFCTAPIEMDYSETVGEPSAALTEFYKIIAKYTDFEVERTDKHIGITTHVLESGEKIAVCINYSPQDITDTLRVRTGSIGKVYLGDIKDNTLNIPAYSCAIFEIK